MIRKLSRRFAVLGMLLLFAPLSACGDDDRSDATPAEACSHYCSCSFAAQIPNCQSVCESGINMANNPASCASCTASSSCTELQSDSCSNACSN